MRKVRSRLAANLVRGVCIFLWFSVIIACVGSYLKDPAAFTPENIALFLTEFHSGIWVIYILISILRGFTLLPSTPLVIAGTILFPAYPFAVLIVSVIGILLSSAMIYYFSDELGFRKVFERYGVDRLEKVRNRLEQRWGVAFVSLWSFFPLVPTDLVCYVAGIVRMNFLKFITAIFVGELVLCSIYIFLGNALVSYLH